jgi:hypothetical protein
MIRRRIFPGVSSSSLDRLSVRFFGIVLFSLSLLLIFIFSLPSSLERSDPSPLPLNWNWNFKSTVVEEAEEADDEAAEEEETEEDYELIDGCWSSSSSSAFDFLSWKLRNDSNCIKLSSSCPSPSSSPSSPQPWKWLFFWGDSLMRHNFAEAVQLLSVLDASSSSFPPPPSSPAPPPPASSSPSSSSSRKLRTSSLNPEDCLEFRFVRQLGNINRKCVLWDYWFPILKVRITYRAKFRIFEPSVDPLVLQNLLRNLTILITEGAERKNQSSFSPSPSSPSPSPSPSHSPFFSTPSSFSSPELWIYFNSGLWDLLYGEGKEGYKTGLSSFLHLMKTYLAEEEEVEEGSGTTGRGKELEEVKRGNKGRRSSFQLIWTLTTSINSQILVEWKRPQLNDEVVRKINQETLRQLPSLLQPFPSSSLTPSSSSPSSSSSSSQVKVIDPFWFTQVNSHLSVDGIHFDTTLSSRQTHLLLHLTLCPSSATNSTLLKLKT